MDTIDEEEMKELLAEEMAKYEDEGYFKRLFKMFAGLGRPHASREYKEAVIELQRQIAPILAILVPLVGAAILFVVTAMGGSSEQKINVEIAQVEEEKPLDEIEQPPETEPPCSAVAVMATIVRARCSSVYTSPATMILPVLVLPVLFSV